MLISPTLEVSIMILLCLLKMAYVSFGNGNIVPLQRRLQRDDTPKHRHKLTVDNVPEERKKLSAPARFGPGKWSDLHKFALYCSLHNKFDAYAEFAKFTLSTLECLKCRKHAMKNLKSFPIEDQRGRVYDKPGSKYHGKVLDCFIWSVLFHNVVNRQLGKPEMTEEAALLLHDSEIIDEACDVTCAFTPPTTTYPSYPR